MGNKSRRIVFVIFCSIVAVLFALMELFPLVWSLLASFKGPKEVYKINPVVIFPTVWYVKNYSTLFTASTHNFVRSYLLTLGCALGFSVMAIFFNSIAAYAFARLDFRFKKILWAYILFPMFIPGITITITSYVVCNQLHLLDTLWVLILPGLVGSYAIFFVRQFFLSMPRAVEEAALVDGAGRFRIYWNIFLPSSVSPLVLIGTGGFTGFWNGYLWPSLTITSPNKVQIMQVVRSFSNTYTTNAGAVYAGAVLVCLPPLIVFMIFQRYIIKGMLISGLK
ncbi:MAG: carbohydrate ABC transporter permease [Clostridia bacterium]|nr:carbohydrate ABC transporter permease [Clostridia bacterium]